MSLIVKNSPLLSEDGDVGFHGDPPLQDGEEREALQMGAAHLEPIEIKFRPLPKSTEIRKLSLETLR